MRDEREIFERFVDGDLDAFEAIFSEYQRDVFGWIHRIVRDRGEAEDLTVETFWRIYVARARFDPGRSFAAWARRIATNAALNLLRARRPEEPLLSEPRAPSGRDPLERDELRAHIESALATLSPKLRVVATLALIEEVPYGEIAASLGLSREAVKSRVFRAVRKLRKVLAVKGIEP